MVLVETSLSNFDCCFYRHSIFFFFFANLHFLVVGWWVFFHKFCWYYFPVEFVWKQVIIIIIFTVLPFLCNIFFISNQSWRAWSFIIRPSGHHWLTQQLNQKKYISFSPRALIDDRPVMNKPYWYFISSLFLFQHEYHLYKLVKHENIVSFHVAFVHDNELWVIMPLMEQGKLELEIKVIGMQTDLI